VFYIRYGDDFLILDKNVELVTKNRELVLDFIKNNPRIKEQNKYKVVNPLQI
jgi:hypothetical protein